MSWKYLPEFLLCGVKSQCHFLWDIFILFITMSITSPSLCSSGYKSRLFPMVVRPTFPRSAISEFIYQDIWFDFHFQHHHLDFLSFFFYGCIFAFVGQFYFWIIQFCNMSGEFILGSKNATQTHALVSVCENSITNHVREISSINVIATSAKVQYWQVVYKTFSNKCRINQLYLENNIYKNGNGSKVCVKRKK